MAKKGRMTVLKRQREVRKAEKAALKREKRETRASHTAEGPQVATADDLADYGFEDEPRPAGKSSSEPPPSDPSRPARAPAPAI